MRINSATHKIKGFSLIELSIGLMIIGLLAAGVAQTYGSYLKAKPMKDTTARMAIVQTAMERFLVQRGRLPCPAAPAVAPDNPNSGVEQCTAPAVLVTSGRAMASPMSSSVLIGAVPYATLGIELKSTYDAWSRQYIYAVSQNLTNLATYKEDAGVISVVNSTGANALGGAGTAGTAHIVLLSQGAAGNGAYSFEGKLSAACNPALGRDAQNCDGNATFADNSGRSLVPGVNRYESIVHPTFRIIATSDKWAFAAGQTSGTLDIPAAAVNSLSGNVGIGTNTPQARLDVAGNIRAAQMSADNYCKDNGQDCFRPEIIGGTGMDCPRGMMLKISNGTRTCIDFPDEMKVNTGGCPDQYVMVGVDASGNPKCKKSIHGFCSTTWHKKVHSASAAGTPSVAPSGSLCITGQKTAVSPAGAGNRATAWTWKCLGSYAGTDEDCTYGVQGRCSRDGSGTVNAFSCNWGAVSNVQDLSKAGEPRTMKFDCLGGGWPNTYTDDKNCKHTKGPLACDYKNQNHDVDLYNDYCECKPEYDKGNGVCCDDLAGSTAPERMYNGSCVANCFAPFVENGYSCQCDISLVANPTPACGVNCPMQEDPWSCNKYCSGPVDITKDCNGNPI